VLITVEADDIFDKASFKKFLITIKTPDSMMLTALLLYERDQEIKTVCIQIPVRINRGNLVHFTKIQFLTQPCNPHV
jgi:hypothetical protein